MDSLKYKRLVYKIAKSIKSKNAFNCDLGDMVNSGYVGLLQALIRYKKEPDDKFLHYAQLRIKGSIIDDMRKMGMARGRNSDLKKSVIFNDIDDYDLTTIDNPCTYTIAKDLLIKAQQKIQSRKTKQRQVLEMHFLKCKKPRDIARDLGYTEGRVSQIISEFRVDIKDMINGN